MDTPDAAGLATYPGFRPPASRRLDPALPEVGTADPESPTLAGDPARPSAPSTLKPGPGDTRTATLDSTGSAPKPSAKDAARLVAGLLGLAVVGVAALVRIRRGVQLRRPTETELDDVAAPLARIGLRHVPAGVFHADLADFAAAASAAGAYLNNGPLIEREYVDPGVPADLNRGPDEEI